MLVYFCVLYIQTGCMGCASGKNAGPRNIFGNKYGQNLAAVQIAREKRAEQRQLAQIQEQQQQQQQANRDDDDDEETDDEDDYGPAPTAGIWAGSEKLQLESERAADDDDDGEQETDDEQEEEGPDNRPSKKVRT
jgi:bud site selection protein 31